MRHRQGGHLLAVPLGHDLRTSTVTVSSRTTQLLGTPVLDFCPVEGGWAVMKKNLVLLSGSEDQLSNPVVWI